MHQGFGMLRKQFRLFFISSGLALLACVSLAQAPGEPKLASDVRESVDGIARQVLASTGVPSASLAIVRDGQIAYVQAYGNARLDPLTPARPEMRYSIGSISKQFTATAILMLAEEGKLSLDDPVARFLPTLTRANEVTVRQLLSHTSGYQDYWPQDYVPPFMRQEITAERILDLWARKPLDFNPGTQWQYSNTNFVIAGVIVEKASGMPLLELLRSKIFAPLDMQSVANVDQERLGETDPAGYMRYALGPPRVAPKEGKGWLFAAGELAMPARDLAKWDIGVLDQRLLKPSSYQEMETEIKLKSGAGAHYGLGIGVANESGRRILEHGGEVSGFTAENMIFPDDRAAIIVLTNQDAINASGQIARKIMPLLFVVKADASAKKLQQAREIFEGLQHGALDRSLFTANANSYFTEQAIQDFAASLAPLGAPGEFTQTAQQERGGMTARVFRVTFAKKVLIVSTYEMPDGKLEQYLVLARE
jgi:D-alanyl-D-alanine carboxypeptidase